MAWDCCSWSTNCLEDLCILNISNIHFCVLVCVLCFSYVAVERLLCSNGSVFPSFGPARRVFGVQVVYTIDTTRQLTQLFCLARSGVGMYFFLSTSFFYWEGCQETKVLPIFFFLLSPYFSGWTHILQCSSYDLWPHLILPHPVASVGFPLWDCVCCGTRTSNYSVPCSLVKSRKIKYYYRVFAWPCLVIISRLVASCSVFVKHGGRYCCHFLSFASERCMLLLSLLLENHDYVFHFPRVVVFRRMSDILISPDAISREWMKTFGKAGLPFRVWIFYLLFPVLVLQGPVVSITFAAE